LEHTLAGNLHVHEAFHSRHWKADRNVIVYLPPDYKSNSQVRYPVCYLQDGQNLFDPVTAFAGNDWGLGETIERLTARQEIEPLIIVGIYNTGERRLSEYTHVRDRRRRGGGAQAYGRAILEDLKPFIDRQYRTRTEAQHTALGGSSLGGLVTFYLGLLYPRVFGKLIVMSPSLWWANRDILKFARKAKRDAGQKIWLDVGTREGEAPETCVRDARDVRDTLLAKGWQVDFDLKFVEDEGGEHNEQAWGRRVPDALRFLFPPSGTVNGKVA
jgi:predicted alpha/beta superfamily hydrolase